MLKYASNDFDEHRDNTFLSYVKPIITVTATAIFHFHTTEHDSTKISCLHNPIEIPCESREIKQQARQSCSCVQRRKEAFKMTWRGRQLTSGDPGSKAPDGDSPDLREGEGETFERGSRVGKTWNKLGEMTQLSLERRMARSGRHSHFQEHRTNWNKANVKSEGFF